MNNTIRIATIGVAEDYRQSLVPKTLLALGYKVEWTKEAHAELIIYGPFQEPLSRRDRFIPKPLRPLVTRFQKREIGGYKPITLFQTGENLRRDHCVTDFTISFDLAISNNRHMRLPYWMELVDWRHEGIQGMTNSRFGQLLAIPRLMAPLGRDFLRRPMKAAFFSSHLREPRRTLYSALKNVIDVDGFGSQFDASIVHHSASAIHKMDVLRNYAVNLCPENGMHPGYYTEKIPEAFHAGCLPISWVDENVAVDFNPDAFINLAPMMRLSFSELAPLLQSKPVLERYSEQALVLQRPTLDNLKAFLREIIASLKT